MPDTLTFWCTPDSSGLPSRDSNGRMITKLAFDDKMQLFSTLILSINMHTHQQYISMKWCKNNRAASLRCNAARDWHLQSNQWISIAGLLARSQGMSWMNPCNCCQLPSAVTIVVSGIHSLCYWLVMISKRVVPHHRVKTGLQACGQLITVVASVR